MFKPLDCLDTNLTRADHLARKSGDHTDAIVEPPEVQKTDYTDPQSHRVKPDGSICWILHLGPSPGAPGYEIEINLTELNGASLFDQTQAIPASNSPPCDVM